MKDSSRRKFIGSAFGAFGLAGLAFNGSGISFFEKNESESSVRLVRLKGKQDSKITHWDVITIGNLSRNRYWGESDERAIHDVLCTCTVISGTNFHLIVDPSIADERAMTIELSRRTGLTPDKINAVFITHQHADHLAGLKHFSNARWFAGAEVAMSLNKSARFSRQFETEAKSLFDAIDIISTPGHTPDHNSLRFDYKGLSVVVAGDSVATRDFWDDRSMFYNAVDLAESKRTMEKINSIADIIVPGHDNCFFNL